MENINISFEENANVLSATKCESDCSSIMFDKYDWGIRGYTAGLDEGNGDVLFFFPEEDLPIRNQNKYVTEYICSLKKAWNEAGFSIIEERFSENGECFHVGFLAHFFRLRKRNVICECGICSFSEYGRCCNEKIMEQFKNISLIKEVTIVSSRINCLEFNEEPHAHDVE